MTIFERFNLTKRHWLFFFIFFAVATAVVQFYGRGNRSGPTPQTAVADFADLTTTVQATGVLVPLRKVDVGAQVTGQVQKLYVELGQHVRQGDLLATIDPTLAQKELQGQEAALEQQDATLESKRIDLAAAELELERQKKMFIGDATSANDLENAKNRVASLSADVRGFSAQLRQTRIQVDSLQAKLNYTRIVAPIEGDVINIQVQEGQTVTAAQQVPTVMTLAQMDTMTVRARVPEADVMRIRRGQKVYFTTLGNSALRHYGTVRTVQPSPELIHDVLFYNGNRIF